MIAGEILSFSITPGNVDDRVPVPKMTKNFIGKLFGDKSDISKKLAELLAMNDVELITKLKKNMKPKIIAVFAKILLRKRSIIETIIAALARTRYTQSSIVDANSFAPTIHSVY
jgi:hypothetical protein